MACDTMRANPIIDAPEAATAVLARALNVDESAAFRGLLALVKAGYFVAPREPISPMLGAYIDAYGTPPSNARSFLVGFGKARKRWKAMGDAGTRMALTRSLTPSTTEPL